MYRGRVGGSRPRPRRTRWRRGNRAGLFWGVPAFWRRAGPGSDPRVVLHVNWKRSWAESRGVSPHDYKTVFVVRAWAILLPRAAVEAVFVVSKPRRKAGPGTDRTYDHEAIRAVAKEVLKPGRDKIKAAFFERVRNACSGKTKTPENDTTMDRIVGNLWRSGAPGRGQT